jgi:hypothetical protein
MKASSSQPQEVGVSEPLAAFGGVSPLQGGDYVSHKARVSLLIVRGRRERSERGVTPADFLCKAECGGNRQGAGWLVS